MTRTTFSTPTLADGRDLLYHIIPKKFEGEWRPSMNLFDLIQHIPDFIVETLTQQSAVAAGAAP